MGKLMKTLTQEEVLRAAFKHHEALTVYAYGLVRDWSLAQDAVQEAYLVLVNKWQSYQPGGDLYSWVRQMVKFEALDLLRSRGKERYLEHEELLLRIDQELEIHLDERSAVHMREEREALKECMSGLGGKALGLLLGFYRQALPCEKLAETNHTSPNAVRLLLSRLRKQLRECLSVRLSLKGS
jgi:RNA polymerase sigma-70 factor (ECF subfamily)